MNKTYVDADFENIIRKTVTSCYSLLILASLTMNTIVLLAVYFEKNLQNANKYFVASLAFSDIVVVCLSVSIRMYQYIKVNPIKNIELCRFWIWGDIVSELSSITTLTVISVDRYYKVCRPFKYKSWMSTKKCMIIIAIVWLYSCIMASLGLLSFGDSKGVHIAKGGYCRSDNKHFFIVFLLLGFFIPVLILIIMCSLMFRVVRQFRRSRNQNTNVQSLAVPRIHVNSKKVGNSNKRTVAVFSLVVLAFVVCWGPFFIFFLIIQYNKKFLALSPKNHQILSTICFNILPYLNSFINPIIYAFFDKSFNAAIQKLVNRITRMRYLRERSFSNRPYSPTLLQGSSYIGKNIEEHAF